MLIEEIKARCKRRLEGTEPYGTPGTWYHEDIPKLLSEIDHLNKEKEEIVVLCNERYDKIQALTSELEQNNRELSQLAIERVNCEKQLAELDAKVQHLADVIGIAQQHPISKQPTRLEAEQGNFN